MGHDRMKFQSHLENNYACISTASEYELLQLVTKQPSQDVQLGSRTTYENRLSIQLE
jgi:hypothetical protein